MNYIITSQENTAKQALNELKKADPSCRAIKWLDAGVCLISSDLGNQALASLIFDTPVFFIRHIFKVEFELNTASLGIDEIAERCADASHERLSRVHGVSLQIRAINSAQWKSARNELRAALQALLEQRGIYIDMKSRDAALSVFLTDDTAYFGVSPAYLNLSGWNGGMMHCARENNEISRSECKLLEAFDAFSIDISNFSTGLDLGAAPGGWSNVLINRGISVVAVDPADMDARIKRSPKLSHYKETTQAFLKRPQTQRYDIIVNDMKMDVMPSSAIFCGFSRLLNPNGVAVMTYKLPYDQPISLIREGFDLIRSRYKLVTARQLFHNRSEITLFMRAK